MEQSTYWLPLSEARLETQLKASINDTPDNVIALGASLAKRDPRNTFARSALAGAYLQKGDVSALETHFFPLYGLTGTNPDGFSQFLVRISADPQSFNAITSHIKKNKPVWGSQYLGQLMKEPTIVDPSKYQDLFSYYPNQLSNFNTQLFKRFGAERAYESFIQMSNEAPTQDGLIVDPDFTKGDYQWPFGWRLNTSVVERERDGGVSLVYFGRGTPVLLEQIAKAGAGTYQAKISLSGNASRVKGYYAFRVNCWKGVKIAELIIDDVALQTKTLNLDFKIEGQDCNFIQVQVLGQAGNFPGPVRTQIESIQITSVDRL